MGVINWHNHSGSIKFRNNANKMMYGLGMDIC